MSPLFEAISGTRLRRIMLGVFVLGVLVTAGLVVGQDVYTWTGNSTFSSIATIDVGRLGLIAGVCGVAAVVVAALLDAAHIRRRRRERIPRLALTLTVSREPAGDWHDTLVMILEIENTGDAAVGIGTVRWTASVLSPYDNDAVEAMKQEYAQRAEGHAHVEFPWHVAFRESVVCDLSVNPGWTERIVYTHPIDSRIHALMASAYVATGPNNRFKPAGWYALAPLINSRTAVAKGGEQSEPTTPSGAYAQWQSPDRDTTPVFQQNPWAP